MPIPKLHICISKRVIIRDSPDGRRNERNSASIRFPLQGEAVALEICGSSFMGVARSAQNSLIFPSSGRTSPLIFARATTERLTPVRDQAAAVNAEVKAGQRSSWTRRANPAKVLPVRGETMRSLGPEHPDTKGACSIVSQPYDRDIAADGRVTNGLACMAETPEQRVVGHFE
jgi:hypothetical protein